MVALLSPERMINDDDDDDDDDQGDTDTITRKR